MKTLRWVSFLVVGLFLSRDARAAIPISGFVTDDTGAPLPGATLELRPVPSEHEAARIDLEGEPAPVASARSGADGRYRLEAPAAGLYRLGLAAAGRVPLELAPLAVAEEVEAPDAKLGPDARGEVVVRDETGRPLAGAEVRVAVPAPPRDRRPWSAAWRLAAQRGVTDEAGRFAFARDAEAAVEVSAAAPGRGVASVRGARGARVEIALEPGLRRVVEVRLARAAAAGVATLDAATGRTLALSDARGAATIFLPRAGRSALEHVGEGASYARSVVEAKLDDPSKPPAPLRVELEPGRSAVGAVIEREGRRPIAGALVRMLRDDAWTLSDGRGVFRLELRRAAAGPLGASAAGYLDAEPMAANLLPGATEAPTLVLEAASGIDGRVVDPEGRPVAEASLTALSVPTTPRNRPTRRVVLHARADARGAFRLRGLDPSGTVELTATKSGFAPGELTVRELPPRGVKRAVTVTLAPPGQLYGRILTIDESPLAGAELELHPALPASGPRFFASLDSDGRLPTATSDAEGRFVFRDLGGGRFDLVARASGWAEATVPGLELPSGGVAKDVGEILLEPGVAVEGVVVDLEGRPLEGAEVSAQEPGYAAFFARMFGRGRAGPKGVFSGSDGSFSLADRRGGERIDLVASKEGFGVGTASNVEVPPERPIRLVLQPLGRVAGRVVDAEGDGVADAEVEGYVRIGSEGSAASMVANRNLGNAVTGSDGRFELSEVPSGTVELFARTPAGATAEGTSFELPPGASREDVELRVQATGVVTGRVVDPEGRPAVGATVACIVGQDASDRALRATSTDGDGRFRLPGVRPGKRQLTAQLLPFRLTRRDVEVPEGEVSVEIALERGLVIRGVVVDAAGEPVADVRVGVVGGTDDRGAPWPTTDGSGRFETSGMAPGIYRVIASKEGYARAELPEPITLLDADVEGVVLRLERGGVVFGTLRGVEFDELADVFVMASGPGGMRRSSVDYDARYRLEGLTDGEWQMTATVESTGRRASGTAVVGPGAREVELDLELGSGFALSGRVTRRGEPVSGAYVVANGTGIFGSLRAATLADGSFRLEGLEAGTYRVSATDPLAGGSAETTIEISDDAEVELSLASARLEGSVVSSLDRAPIAGATVSLTRAQEDRAPMLWRPQISDSTDVEGAYALADLAPGSYRLSVRAEGYAAAEGAYEVHSEDQAERRDFALDPNEGATLRVHLWTGSPASELWVAGIDASGRIAWNLSATCDAEGLARLTTLPPGDHRLLVSAAGAATVEGTVTSPGGRLDLLLPQPGLVRVTAPTVTARDALLAVSAVDPAGAPYRTVGPVGSRGEQRLWVARGLDMHLPPGGWTLTATGPDGELLSAQVVVTAGAMATAELR